MSINGSAAFLLIQVPLGLWTWLWVWTYPLAKLSVAEAREASVKRSLWPANLVESVLFALRLPIMARSQHMAERSAETGTAVPQSASPAVTGWMARWRSEAAWRSHLREAIVWSTVASWLITWASIGASVAITGNFLFEVHETPDSPGYVSNYFKVAALTFVMPFGWVTGGLATLVATRR